MMKRTHHSPRVLFWLFVLFFTGCGILVFQAVYSTPLPKFVEEINNGALGAILVAIITMFLLDRQSEAEELRERNSVVYKEKAQKFTRFIEALWDTWDDFLIEPDEIQKLRKMFHKDVYIYLKKDSLKKIAENLGKLQPAVGVAIKKENRKEVRAPIYEIINVLKSELMLQTDSTGPEFDAVLDKIDAAFEVACDAAEQKDGESKVQIDSKGPISEPITFWHFCLYDTNDWNWFQEKKKLCLADGDNGSRTQLLRKVNKDDVIFVYVRGSGYAAIVKVTEPGRILDKTDEGHMRWGLEAGNVAEIAVYPLIIPAKAVPRDAPRLKTLQRIYDLNAIRELFSRFKKGTSDTSWPAELNEIESALMKKTP